MTPCERRLRAAVGYLELGLPLEADRELADLDAVNHALPETLAVQVHVDQALERWDRMEAAARQLCEQKPGEPQWPISLGYATRRARSLEQAAGVLTDALRRFPREAIIHYNLACYEAQLGHLESARRRLAEAVKLDPHCAELAKSDPDLTPLR